MPDPVAATVIAAASPYKAPKLVVIVATAAATASKTSRTGGPNWVTREPGTSPRSCRQRGTYSRKPNFLNVPPGSLVRRGGWAAVSRSGRPSSAAAGCSTTAILGDRRRDRSSGQAHRPLDRLELYLKAIRILHDRGTTRGWLRVSIITEHGDEALGPDGAGRAPSAGAVLLPARPVTPLAAVSKRMFLALGLLAVSTVIVYLGRDGYRDAAHPGQPLSVLGCVYYATVTLSTTGFGDIVPVTATARLVNTVLITPIRVIFLILLVGTTLEVLAERTRTSWRIKRWRSRVAGQTVIVGYGTKGRSVIRTLGQSGLPDGSIVVVDVSAEAVAEANAAGLVAVGGDGTRQSVLIRAEIGSAAQVVIAVNRDDTAVLIALTSRQLNPSATIVAAVREEENRQLLRQSGADHVVVSSDAAGQMRAISTIRPAAGMVIADLLDRGRGLDLIERPAAGSELGAPARDAAGTVIAVVRGDEVLASDDPRASPLAAGDRLILVSSRERPASRASG